MNLLWQNLIALAIVLSAGGYLGRALWKTAVRRQPGSCGSCASCPASGERADLPLVELGSANGQPSRPPQA